MPHSVRKIPLGQWSVNFEAVQRLGKLVSASQQIIFPVTNSGYGVGESGIYCTEETPLRPISLYGETKVKAESALLERDNTITLRLATVFWVLSHECALIYW